MKILRKEYCPEMVMESNTLSYIFANVFTNLIWKNLLKIVLETKRLFLSKVLEFLEKFWKQFLKNKKNVLEYTGR